MVFKAIPEHYKLRSGAMHFLSSECHGKSGITLLKYFQLHERFLNLTTFIFLNDHELLIVAVVPSQAVEIV